MSHRRLIESLLASGRKIHRVPDEIRQRIFARALAAAELPVGEATERGRRPCRRRPLLAHGAAQHRRLTDPRRL